MNRYCLTLDLKDDPQLIREYEEHHKKMRPEILQSIKESGINVMEIYRHGNRLFMIMEVDKTFSFERKAQMDKGNAKVEEWENLMWKYQQPIAGAAKGEKWMLMDKIFSLNHDL